MQRPVLTMLLVLFAMWAASICARSAMQTSLSRPPSAPHAPRWQSLPEVPPLPRADKAGYLSVNGARLYYMVFNKGGGRPVLLLHDFDADGFRCAWRVCQGARNSAVRSG
ncbi:MAG TPA: hypothetical protein VFK31_12215 [Rhodanobacteraceae bacterium]|nr:hypothetical protein [Rhodanobacteraceae bacterium]